MWPIRNRRLLRVKSPRLQFWIKSFLLFVPYPFLFFSKPVKACYCIVSHSEPDCPEFWSTAHASMLNNVK